MCERHCAVARLPGGRGLLAGACWQAACSEKTKGWDVSGVREGHLRRVASVARQEAYGWRASNATSEQRDLRKLYARDPFTLCTQGCAESRWQC